MLAILSVFADGWTVGAAARGLDLTEGASLDLLDALAGHSLVQVDATDAGPRFHMLEAVRSWPPSSLLPAPTGAGVEERLRATSRSLVENADWPAERAEWAEQLRTEEENLRVAIRWFLTNDITPLPHMFRILWLYWQMRGACRGSSVERRGT
jgi:hypothetical protein